MSKVLLRWYKSFNVMCHTGGMRAYCAHGWNHYDGRVFPYVEIPIDRRITTVVGLNETGKSHLLSAIAKIFTGKGVGGEGEEGYDRKDICRYCEYGSVSQKIWPNLGVEMTFERMSH